MKPMHICTHIQCFSLDVSRVLFMSCCLEDKYLRHVQFSCANKCRHIQGTVEGMGEDANSVFPCCAYHIITLLCVYTKAGDALAKLHSVSMLLVVFTFTSVIGCRHFVYKSATARR
jgi:hypothetical protein